MTETLLEEPPQQSTDNGKPTQDANGHAPDVELKPKTTKAKPKRPNYAKIHARPLPLEVFPLPVFVPHNPLSLFTILGAIVSEYFSRRSSRPSEKYIGYFSPETRSVHVTDPKHIRALWEMGFFGKGTLSRSEPTWFERETARRKAAAGETSEEYRSERRAERRKFKLERARAEREAIEEQLRREGKMSAPTLGEGKEERMSVADATQDLAKLLATTLLDSRMDAGGARVEDGEELDEELPLVEQEHLQLTLHEAFFLCYGLGVLDIIPLSSSHSQKITKTPWTAPELLPMFAAHGTFPPSNVNTLQPDNPFLLSYVVYHHYRSRGWVVRPGLKFAADWMLYNRGPVFTHAEFAVIIVPEYPSGWDETWQTRTRRKTWWELHCVNRVQGQVVKTLVLCYVEVPLKTEVACGDVGGVLASYKVRDFIVRRFTPNRMRD